MSTNPESAGTQASPAGEPVEGSDSATLADPAQSLALLSDAQRIEVLRERARARRATGEIPERFGARVDQHFNKILQHVRPVDDTDDPLIAAASLLRTPRVPRAAHGPGTPPEAELGAPDRLSRAKRKLEIFGAALDRGDRAEQEQAAAREHERVIALEQTVLELIERVRELERREHRVTALTDRVDELQRKVRKLRRDARAARPSRPHEPDDLDDDSFDDEEFEREQREAAMSDDDATLDDGASETGAGPSR